LPLLPLSSTFLFHYSAPHRHLHSFPTRRSSDLAAMQTYQKALVKFPADFELLKAAGRLDTSLKRFEEAISHLAAAHDRNTTDARSEEHTSELQSRGHLVCRLLLEKKKKKKECTL